MLYRRELVDLSKDTKEARLCVEIAGHSLVPSGPPKLFIYKVDDSTKEGRERLKRFLERGAKVQSVKTDDGSIIDNSTEAGRVKIKKLLVAVDIDPKLNNR